MQLHCLIFALGAPTCKNCASPGAWYHHILPFFQPPLDIHPPPPVHPLLHAPMPLLTTFIQRHVMPVLLGQGSHEAADLSATAANYKKILCNLCPHCAHPPFSSLVGSPPPCTRPFSQRLLNAHLVCAAGATFVQGCRPQRICLQKK